MQLESGKWYTNSLVNVPHVQDEVPYLALMRATGEDTESLAAKRIYLFRDGAGRKAFIDEDTYPFAGDNMTWRLAVAGDFNLPGVGSENPDALSALLAEGQASLSE